jgi:hypothetical protein
MPAIVLAFLMKFWKESILVCMILFLGTAFVVDEWFDNRKYKKLWNEGIRCETNLNTLSEDYDQLFELNQMRNEKIGEWKGKADSRAEALEMALNSPPAVIYRDRIVEVPSIVTGDCEDVFVDVADYVEELVNAP